MIETGEWYTTERGVGKRQSSRGPPGGAGRSTALDQVSMQTLSTSTSASCSPPWGAAPQGSVKDTPRKKIWGLPERFEHLAPQLEQTVEKQGDWQPCSYGGPGPGARPGCTGLAFGHPAQVCCFSLHLSSPLQGFWVDWSHAHVSLITNISP